MLFDRPLIIQLLLKIPMKTLLGDLWDESTALFVNHTAAGTYWSQTY